MHNVSWVYGIITIVSGIIIMFERVSVKVNV